MKKGWLGYDNTAREIKDIYVGVQGKARKVVAGYVGNNGVARKVYPIVPIPAVTGEYVYDGTEKTVTINDLDTGCVDVSGNKATNPGTYTVIYSLKNRAVWEDGTYNNKTQNWSIAKGDFVIGEIYGKQTVRDNMNYIDMECPVTNKSISNLQTEWTLEIRDRGTKEWQANIHVISSTDTMHDVIRNNTDFNIYAKGTVIISDLDNRMNTLTVPISYDLYYHRPWET